MALFLFISYILSASADLSDFPIVSCEYTNKPTGAKEKITIVVRPDWAPLGAQRFLQLVEESYYDSTALFRAMPNFLVQFGLSSNTDLRNQYKGSAVQDDPDLKIPFIAGMMSFAGSGPRSRETQIFITLGEYVEHLGKDVWERPFGKVVGGFESFKNNINYGYGDGAFGAGPNQGKIWREGYAYLEREFPELSYLDSCRLLSLDKEAKVSYLATEAGLGQFDSLWNEDMKQSAPRKPEKQIQLIVNSAMDEAIKVYWKSFDGSEKFSGEIQKYGKLELGSFVGHEFVVRLASTEEFIRTLVVRETSSGQQFFKIKAPKKEL